MSRSGSTLLVKALRKYFFLYHDKDMSVLSRANLLQQYAKGNMNKPMESLINDAAAPKRFENFLKNRSYILKFHVPISPRIVLVRGFADEPPTYTEIEGEHRNLTPAESDKLQKKISKRTMRNIDFSIYCIRDLRDATVSEYISYVASNRGWNRAKSTANLAEYDRGTNKTLKKLSNRLAYESTSWREITSPDFNWKYEDYKKDPLGQFREVFSKMSETMQTKKLSDTEITNLLDSLADPVELSSRGPAESIKAAKERIKHPEVWAIRTSNKPNNTNWNVGVSSTGGKVGCYKEVLHEEYTKQIEKFHGKFLNESGYITE